MKEKSSPELHVTLGSLLRKPYERMSERLYAELAERGYSEVRPAFSAVLRNLPPSGARVSDLAVRAGMTKQSMGYLAQQMVDAGLVTIRPDPLDGRANVVKFTARGTRVVALAIELTLQYEREFAQVVGEKKMEQLRAILQDICDHLEPPTQAGS